MNTKKIIFAGLLAFVTMFVFAQSENDFEVEQLADGTLRITGYNGWGGDITIPGKLFGLPVTEIGPRAFESEWIPDTASRAGGPVRPLTTVTIENGIKKIGSGAFRSTDLRYINFPDTLEEIGERVFAGCNLQELKLPKGLTTIAREAFAAALFNCESVLIIPSSVKSIGSYAFGSFDDKREPKIRELVLEGIFTRDRTGVPFDLPFLEKITITANWPDNGLNIGLPDGFVNFYKSQGKKGGAYVKRGPVWTLSQ